MCFSVIFGVVVAISMKNFYMQTSGKLCLRCMYEVDKENLTLENQYVQDQLWLVPQ